MDELNYVGVSKNRVDAREKATGRAVYVDDIKLPGMLFGKILRSPYPHARLIGVDASKAFEVPGVKAVVTADDFRDRRWGFGFYDEPVFAQDEVRYVGEAIAAVAAENREAAENALRLVQVDYEELPAIFDPEEAMKPGAFLLHPDMMSYKPFMGYLIKRVPNSNINNHFQLRRGDVESGFQQADVVVEDRYCSPRIYHGSIEPTGVVANIESDGRVTCYTAVVTPHLEKVWLSHLLDVPSSSIRVVVPFVGGSFGGKADAHTDAIAARLAQKSRRPVKIVYSGEERFYSHWHRIPAVTYVRDGVAKDGRILARRIKIIMDSGAYSTMSGLISTSSGFGASGPYDIPNVSIDAFAVYTNNPMGAAFRGFGTPEVNWGVESHMDAVARAIGMDPVKFRLLNAYEEGDVSANGEILHSVGLKECIEGAAEHLGWGIEPSGPYRAKGFAAGRRHAIAPSTACAFVEIREDGSVEVRQSAVEMGQGAHTMMAQIAAEELQVPVERVRVVRVDTDVTPFDLYTGSSRATYYSGNAVKFACVDAKRQLFQIAADKLEAPPEELETREGKIYVKGSPDRFVRFQDLFMLGIAPDPLRGPILGKGIFTQMGKSVDLNTGQSERPGAFWMYAAQGAEVEVDPETGWVDLVRFSAAHDLGKAVNPVLAEAQIEGGVVQGTSFALREEVLLQNGNILTTDYANYKLPTAADAPDLIDSILVEAAHREGPFGAKGLGEGVLSPTAPAIGNALYNATGTRINDLPLTPEKVWRALRSAKEKTEA